MEELLKIAGDALILINSANWLWKFAKWILEKLQPANKKVPNLSEKATNFKA